MEAEKRQLLDRYLQQVLQANKTINLTTIVDNESAYLLHIEDSLLALPEITKAPSGPLVDLGTGGGFPGVPLGVVTGRQTLLVDSRAKKIRAIMSIIKELGIDNIKGWDKRIEELSLQQPNYYAVATARALTSLPSLLELAAPLLINKGWLIAYKADKIEEELEKACSLEEKLGMKLISKRHATLGDSSLSRTILVFEKTSSPQVELPRRPGMAQKRPYR